jgi:hypothetical protein
VRTWRASSPEARPDGLTYTPTEPLDPLGIEQVRLVAELSTAPRELEQLAWRTRAGAQGASAGRIAEVGGRRVAEFDLSASLSWRLAGEVRSLEVSNGVRPIERGELVARLPELAGTAPEIEGSDWLFPEPGVDRPPEPEGSFVLSLLALSDLELNEIRLEKQSDGEGRLRARGAQRIVARKMAAAPIAWTLEYRIGAQALLRARGSVP